MICQKQKSVAVQRKNGRREHFAQLGHVVEFASRRKLQPC
jgi:hypothetical protein